MTTITSIKHSKRTPVTTFYRASSVVPERYVKYLTVRPIALIGNAVGLEYGLVRFSHETRIVTRRLGSFGWETINSL